MDATPLSLGQEISGWAQMVDNDLQRIAHDTASSL